MSNVLNNAGVLASVAVGGLAVLSAIGWLISRGFRLAKRAGDFFDDYYGQPARDGVAAQPGVMLRLKSLDEHRVEVARALEGVTAETKAEFVTVNRRLSDMQTKVAAIHHETQPNGGDSMKDQLNRLDPGVR